uniref:Transmembrane 6 superfamily member 2 n=1 Tax=Sinocyclocheilus grahami TaxID=75366 RepID=A0A672SHV2_SINGR
KMSVSSLNLILCSLIFVIFCIYRPVVILQIGVTVLVAVFLLVYLATRYNPTKDPLFYVFAEFSFTCVIDLTSALEYDGFTSGFMEFYQKTGEPYLGTPNAIMMCYWDGIAHFILYLMLIHRMSSKQQYRTLGLFWAGSLCANMIVFVPGIVVGSEIRPAFWLNIFLLVPIWGAVSLFSRPRNILKALICRPLDLLFVRIGKLVLTIRLQILNGYVTEYEPYLKDPVGFPKVTILLLLFRALPMLGSFEYGLCTPGCTWMLDWMVYFAGAILQCQWSHAGASLHPHTAEMYRIPVTNLVPILLFNLLYAAGLVLLILHSVFQWVPVNLVIT